MSTNVAEIEAKIRSLSLEDKTELIRSLISELDSQADADVESASALTRRLKVSRVDSVRLSD